MTGSAVSKAPRFTLIAAALIRDGDSVLLVQQQGAQDAAPSWALPGGRVERGELVPEALMREVREETGLVIDNPGRLLYTLQHDDPLQDRQMLVFVFAVAAWHGTLRQDDPDTLVRAAEFVPCAQAIERAERTLPWRIMREPLVAHLRGEAAAGTLWLYRCGALGNDSLLAKL